MSSTSVVRFVLITLALALVLTGLAEAGIDVWTSNGPVGEQVLALAIDPVTPSTLYAAAFNTGVFKSSDTGASWNAINNGLIEIFVRSLTIDLLTPSTLYAGTDPIGTNSGGVFKSTDSGDSWISISNGLTNADIRALAIDPFTPSILYAGSTGDGVFDRAQEGFVLADGFESGDTAAWSSSVP